MSRRRTASILLPLLLLACSGEGGDLGATGGLGPEVGGQVASGGAATGGASSGGVASDGGSSGSGPGGGSSSGGGSPAGGGTSGGTSNVGGTGGMIVEPSGGRGGEDPGTGGAQGGESSGGAPSSGGAGPAGGTTGGGGTSSSGGQSGGGGTTGGCPHSGNVTYQLNGPESWPQDARELITSAMDEAVQYYNCYSDLEKQITVNYNEGVPTAEANVDGWLSFGSGRNYMVTATAMHEVGHTLGVGFSPWTELTQDGRWVGPAVDELMSNLPVEERDQDEYSLRDYITTDSQHFWPYGLNQAAEHQSEWSLINHVRIVAAMNEDKRAYLDGEL